MADAELFNANRRYLLSIAYNMLGSAGEAEDIVQEAFLRWSEAAEEVRNPRAYPKGWRE